MSEPTIICAFCNAEGEPAASDGAIGICGACGGTVVRLMPGERDTRRATIDDVNTLSPNAVIRLRRARAAIARPGKRAVG